MCSPRSAALIQPLCAMHGERQRVWRAGLDADFAHMQLGAAAPELPYQRPYGSMLQPEALHSALGPPGPSMGMSMGMAPGYPEPTPNLFCQARSRQDAVWLDACCVQPCKVCCCGFQAPSIISAHWQAASASCSVEEALQGAGCCGDAGRAVADALLRAGVQRHMLRPAQL